MLITARQYLVNDLKNIIDMCEKSSPGGREYIEENESYSGVDQQAIYNSFQGVCARYWLISLRLRVCANFLGQFVTSHQQLLETVIGKRAFISPTIFAAPLAVILRSLGNAIDGMTLGIINIVPNHEEDVAQKQNTLDGTLDEAISTCN